MASRWAEIEFPNGVRAMISDGRWLCSDFPLHTWLNSAYSYKAIPPEPDETDPLRERAEIAVEALGARLVSVDGDTHQMAEAQ